MGMELNLLDGRAAVVTGSAQGIGLAIATVLARNGASVVISDVNAEGAKQAAADLEAQGLKAIAVPCDVTDETAVEALADACVSAYGSLDVMVNNAGITRDRTLPKMTLEDFRTVVDVHLTGAW